VRTPCLSSDGPAAANAHCFCLHDALCATLVYDFIKEDAGRYFPQLQGLARITLFEASDKILGGFDSSLSAYAAKRFARQGIVLRTGT